MYVILTRYLKPFAEVEPHVTAHRSFLDTWYRAGLLIASGPQVPRTGGVLLARTTDRTRLVQIFEQDPFFLAQLAEYQFIEFDPVKCAPEFETFKSPAPS